MDISQYSKYGAKEDRKKMNPSRRERKFRWYESTALVVAAGFLVVSALVIWNGVVLMKLEGLDPNQHGLRLSAADGGAWASHGNSEKTLLPASVWATRKLPNNTTSNISSLMTTNETEKALNLCGKFLYSTLNRAIHLKNMGQDVFVATGDIDAMWIRDSVVQMTIYLKHVTSHPWLRFIIDGTIRRNAFNILQDPYANAYEHEWKDPISMELKDQVIGRGGYVATRNYELDSGAYFLIYLYDYYLTSEIYNPEALLKEPLIFEAVMTMVNTWIVEQQHEEMSPYRYYELPNEGKGTQTGFTGMTWSGFRPSDDACKYGYLIPANMHAAAALQRVIILNDRIWHSDDLSRRASKLLKEIENGINKFGIIKDKSGNLVYAYEVDGLGNTLHGFDDANVPSLLSIPLLGWTGYNKEAYDNTRKYLLSKDNKSYYEGGAFKGIGSPHTPEGYIWPMAMVIQGLTEEGADLDEKMVFQMRQLLFSATADAMHESVHKDNPTRFTRAWFEWVSTQQGFEFILKAVLSSSKSSPILSLSRPMPCSWYTSKLQWIPAVPRLPVTCIDRIASQAYGRRVK
jgi:meiotically up-regulated gene 157 (Mug157) protein